MNECTDPLTPFICGNFAGIMCENTIGSYVCQCPDGFMLQQDPMTCLGKLKIMTIQRIPPDIYTDRVYIPM